MSFIHDMMQDDVVDTEDAARALLEYLKAVNGLPWCGADGAELDTVALRCSWAEYTVEEALEEFPEYVEPVPGFDVDLDDVVRGLERVTRVIRVSCSNSVVICTEF